MGQTLEQLNAMMDELHKNETKYLKDNKFEVNEHGVFIFVSSNGNQSIRLDGILRDYKEWLIDNDIVREKF